MPLVKGGNSIAFTLRSLGAIARVLMEERPRWPLWLAPAFGLGVGIYFVLPQEPPGWLGGAFFLALLVIGWLLRRRALVFLLVLGLGTTAAGFAAAQLRTTLVAAPILEKSLNARKVEGEVLAIEPRAKGRRMVLRSPRIDGLAPELTPARVRVTLAGDHGAALRPGDLVSLRAVLRPPPSPVSPGAFDFARRAYFQRLGGFGFALGGVVRLPAVPGANAASVASVATTASVAPGRLQTLGTWWEGLRQALAERIRRHLTGDTGAVAVALMIGQRGGISEAVLEDMRGSGLAHLLAISGLHMGLVAGWLFLVIRGGLALLPRLALFYPIKKWAAVVAGLGALLYLFIAGAPIPTLRAFIMVATVLAAVVLDRRALSLRLVAWAGVIILLVLPESLVSVSFQLSFAAVVALIAAYESLTLRGRGWTAERSWPVKAAVYIGGVGLTSVIATLATGPFIAYHFNRIALYGLLANLLAVPLTALWIMPWALAAFLLMPFGLEALALIPMGWGIELLLAVAKQVASLPGAFLALKAMPLVALLSFAAGGLWLCIWRQRWRFLGLAGFAIGFLLASLSSPPDIWVREDGRLFALRGGDGRLYLSSRRLGRFEAEIWQRRAGLDEAASFPVNGFALGGALRCDVIGCVYRQPGGRLVAFVVNPRGLAEDCAVASVVISREPLRGVYCHDPDVVIDRFDLWRNGAYSLRLHPDGVTVETVSGARGRRPWVPNRSEQH